MTISILKALLVIITLVVMILVLLSINHLFSRNFEAGEAEIDDMRHDVEEKKDVITEHSVFGELVDVSSSRNTEK